MAISKVIYCGWVTGSKFPVGNLHPLWPATADIFGCEGCRVGGGGYKAHSVAKTKWPRVFHYYQTTRRPICVTILNVAHLQWICRHMHSSNQSSNQRTPMMTIMILTGFGPGGGGAVLTGGAEPSPDSSSCLLMSSVVKRLDSSPRMWMIANLLAGLGCTEIHKNRFFMFCFSEPNVHLAYSAHHDTVGK